VAKLNLGRVAFVLCGEWAEGTYNKLDVVYYAANNNTYVSRVDNNTALPTDSSKWLIIADVATSIAAANAATARANTAAQAAEEALAGLVDEINKIHIVDDDNGKTYAGIIHVTNGKPTLVYDEKTGG